MWYIEHAKAEFAALGYKPVEECEDGPDKWIQENVIELLSVFAEQGHSGASAPFAIDYFTKLANGEPLCPLTGEDREWQEVSDGVFQNKRCSKIFKESGKAYTLDGYVFWHWSERDLEEDEDGYPGTRKFKSYFTSRESRKSIIFPYIVQKPEYVEVDCYEVNKETGDKEPGSGWWETIYPDFILSNKFE